MKILITTDWYEPVINGVVTSVRNLKREMEKRGHEVRVLTLSDSGRARKEKDVYFIPSVSLKQIYPGARGSLPFFGNSFVKELIRWRPDVVHSQCEFMTFCHAVRISRACGCPLVHTCHTSYGDYVHYLPKGIRNDWNEEKIVASFLRVVLKKVDVLVVPSKKVEKILNSYGITEKISVVPSGISLHRFSGQLTQEEKIQRRSALGFLKDRKILVSIGRLAKEKNLEEILVWFARLIKEGEKSIGLLIGGDGPDRQELEQMTDMLGIREQVRFTGMIPPEKVGEIYQLGHVFVCASTSETQGMTYMEAMASRVPVLCRRDLCLDGVVLDGWNGFQYDSYEQFKLHVKYLLENETRRQEMGQAGWETAQVFSDRNFGISIEKVYEEAFVYADQYDVQGRYRERARSSVCS